MADAHVNKSAEIAALRQRVQELEEAQKELALLSAYLLKLWDGERRRIAKDLHDTAAQTISALALNLAVLRRRIAAGDPQLEPIISECCGLADQAGLEIRNLAHVLHPPAIDSIAPGHTIDADPENEPTLPHQL